MGESGGEKRRGIGGIERLKDVGDFRWGGRSAFGGHVLAEGVWGR